MRKLPREANEGRLGQRLQEIYQAARRSLARLTLLTLASGIGLGVVMYFGSVRVPLAGGFFGMELIDVGLIPGCGPVPGWYSGPLLADARPRPDAPIGAYSAWYGREWGLLLQFADPGTATTRRTRQPTRFITEHPLTNMLMRRVESGRLTGDRLQQLLGPPTRRLDSPQSGSEWRYEFPDWTGGFRFEFDRNGTAYVLDLGKG